MILNFVKSNCSQIASLSNTKIILHNSRLLDTHFVIYAGEKLFAYCARLFSTKPS